MRLSRYSLQETGSGQSDRKKNGSNSAWIVVVSRPEMTRPADGNRKGVSHITRHECFHVPGIIRQHGLHLYNAVILIEGQQILLSAYRLHQLEPPLQIEIEIIQVTRLSHSPSLARSALSCRP